uniref:Putative secreted protein n=1 Tax=Ixodes ricinus TaxID=34613 RepID=A0A6B0UC88_IXORI
MWPPPSWSRGWLPHSRPSCPWCLPCSTACLTGPPTTLLTWEACRHSTTRTTCWWRNTRPTCRPRPPTTTLPCRAMPSFMRQLPAGTGPLHRPRPPGLMRTR